MRPVMRRVPLLQCSLRGRQRRRKQTTTKTTITKTRREIASFSCSGPHAFNLCGTKATHVERSTSHVSPDTRHKESIFRALGFVHIKASEPNLHLIQPQKQQHHHHQQQQHQERMSRRRRQRSVELATTCSGTSHVRVLPHTRMALAVPRNWLLITFTT